jgi:branched-chain amino acid transport system substrate-binding protein
METQGAPVKIGLLFDFPQPDGGDGFETAIRLGVEQTADRRDRPIEFSRRLVTGLPLGTAHDVEQAFAELQASGVLAIVGPSISDNGLIVKELADQARLPCINYTGGAVTRGEYMLHYQVGSIEEEPVVLARYLRRQGHRRVAVIYDQTPVGHGYYEFFELAAATEGLEIAGAAAISAIATDAVSIVERMASSTVDALVYLGLGVAARTVALAVDETGWKAPVVANSALMFGYGRKDWRPGWEGWVYVDTVADDNVERQRLRELSRLSAAGPIGVAAYDIGRLLGEALVRCGHLTRDGLLEGLERVKRLPASSGHEGTIMGFGGWDHAALKGEYLVLRSWRDGRTVQLASGPSNTSGASSASSV